MGQNYVPFLNKYGCKPSGFLGNRLYFHVLCSILFLFLFLFSAIHATPETRTGHNHEATLAANLPAGGVAQC